jgi:uncharacterized membrane protein YkvA (DUF1232 family)
MPRQSHSASRPVSQSTLHSLSLRDLRGVIDDSALDAASCDSGCGRVGGGPDDGAGAAGKRWANLRNGMTERWRERARQLRREVYALYLACRDPRAAWYAKAVAFGLVAYALSPIDLIPDVVPVLGYLDELIVIPLGVLLVRRLLPAEVLADCRARAEVMAERPVSRVGAALVIGVWLLLAGLSGWLVWRWWVAN